MTDRCWDELYRAGQALAEGRPLQKVVDEVAVYFDLPSSPEAAAMSVFLDELAGALEPGLLDLLEAEAALGEAAE